MLPKLLNYYLLYNQQYCIKHTIQNTFFQSSGSVQLEPQTYETGLRLSPRICWSGTPAALRGFIQIKSCSFSVQNTFMIWCMKTVNNTEMAVLYIASCRQ